MAMCSKSLSPAYMAIGRNWALRARERFESCDTTREIVIGLDGTIQYLHEETVGQALESTGTSHKTRASHIEPLSWPLRILFHLLRGVVGETGAVASWTRLWPILWRVNLTPSGGPIYGRFRDRAIAIKSEERWLIDNAL